jgi:hypothetical protein
MNVFFDHNLSFTLARALQELFRNDHTIIALSDKLNPRLQTSNGFQN